MLPYHMQHLQAEKPKAVESLNSLVLQDAFEELCEEAKLHANSHDDTNYAE